MRSFLNTCNKLRVFFKFSTASSAWVSVLFSALCLAVPSSRAHSVTNVVTYDDWVTYHSFVTSRCAAVFSEADNIDLLITQIRGDISEANGYVLEASRLALSASNGLDGQDREDLIEAVDNLDAVISVWSEVNTFLDTQRVSVQNIRQQASAVSSALPNFSRLDFETGGCECPDYTELLESLLDEAVVVRNALTDLQTGDSLYWYFKDQGDALYEFWFTTSRFLLRPPGINDSSYDSYPFANVVAQSFGPVLSNAWDSVAPQTLQRRITRYSQYIDNDSPIDLEPTPQEIATDSVMTAIVGLLYRIQHKLYSTNVADVVSDYRQERDEKEEEAEDAESSLEDELQIARDQVPDYTYSANFEFFSVFSSLADAIAELRRAIRDSGESSYLMVFASEGFSVNLGRNQVVRRDGVIGIPSTRNSGTSGLWSGLSSFSSCIWYLLGALLGLYLTYWCVRIFVTAVSLAFSAVSGNLGSSSILAARLGSVFTGD